MSDDANKLTIIVIAVFAFTFLPIIAIIAMIIASIGSRDEGEACVEVNAQRTRFAYPMPDKTEVLAGFERGDSPENPKHAGIDFKTDGETDVKASADGKVIEADKDRKIVKIQHADRFQTWYTSLRDVVPDEGAQVKAGDKIGTSGTAGESSPGKSGEHLHFELRGDSDGKGNKGFPLDPKEMLDQSDAQPGCGCGGATGEFFNRIPEPWRSLIAQTAPKYPKIDPRLVAATLWAENRGWPKYKTTWPVSSAGAQGPWQFIDSTWASIGTDGDGDGIKDRNNPKDQVHAAFLHHPDSMGKPILNGATNDVEADFKNLPFNRSPRDNLMAYMANYNGNGAPSGVPIDQFPKGDQNSDYVRMGYWLIATDFTKGWHPELDKLVDAPTTGEGAGGSGDGEGGAQSTSGCVGGSNPIVNIDGHDYSFPVVIAKNEVTNNAGRWPCPQACHHDSGPAFDLAKKPNNDDSTGVPVLAVTSGRIENFSNSYKGEVGCIQFQLVGDDGWWYWYGHTQGEVRNGQKVKAGEQIGIIGERRCTGNGSYPHLHIDRGSPKGSPGGTSGQRHESFVPLMNQLHESLGQ